MRQQPAEFLNEDNYDYHTLGADIQWTFIAQMAEHCSTNAETIGLNPEKALNLYFISFLYRGGGMGGFVCSG